MEYSSPEETEDLLFDGVERTTVDFGPVFGLAADLFTHIGLAFMNAQDNRLRTFISPPMTNSANSTTRAVSLRCQETLKLMTMKRDGTLCHLTQLPFFGLNGCEPTLARFIPRSVRTKSDTMRYIAFIGGKVARDDVMQYSWTIDNVFTMNTDAATTHQLNQWGIEASRNPGPENQCGMVQYFFRLFCHDPQFNIGAIRLRDGDEISFGGGREGDQLHHGPHPTLCNLRLAVARALYTSGASGFIQKLIDDAEEADCRHDTLKAKDFDILNAKLLISGRAQIV